MALTPPTPQTATCSLCSTTARYVGSVHALCLTGWTTDDEEKRLFCPDHCVRGGQYLVQQVAAARLFLWLAFRSGQDPTLASKLIELANIPAGAGLSPRAN